MSTDLKQQKKCKIKLTRLPKEMIPIPCADKAGWTEKWYKNRDPLNIPAPWRGVFTGLPSCGKSTAIKNIILRSDPPFEEIKVVHFAPDTTREWDDIEAEVVSEIPTCDEFDGGETKKLLVLEDLELSCIDKENKKRLNRLFGYGSSHQNISIAITAQNAYDIPTSARRTANIFCIWLTPDITALTSMASRTALKKDDFLEILNKHLKKLHDSLMIDLTKDTPFPLRVNGYTMLKRRARQPTKRLTIEEV
jgi:hypothetical protein